MTPIFDQEFPAQTAALTEVRAALDAACRDAGMGERGTTDLVLAVNEACMNVIQHGYAYAPDAVFRLRLLQDAGMLHVQVLDNARPAGLDDLCPRALDDLRPGGLGVHFMRQLSDGIDYLPAPAGYGNLLQISKRIA